MISYACLPVQVIDVHIMFNFVLLYIGIEELHHVLAPRTTPDLFGEIILLIL